MKNAKSVTTLALLIGFGHPCTAGSYYKCTDSDGIDTYQTYRCKKGQKSIKLRDDDRTDPRNLESGALILQCSPCGPGYSWGWASPEPQASNGGQEGPRASSGKKSSENAHAERCLAIDYLELRDMPIATLNQTYCNYEKWAKIHKSNLSLLKNAPLHGVEGAELFTQVVNAPSECYKQLERMLNVFQNRGVAPRC